MLISRSIHSRTLSCVTIMFTILLIGIAGLTAPTSSALSSGSSFLPTEVSRVFSSTALKPGTSQTFTVSAPKGATEVILQVTGGSKTGNGEVTFCGGKTGCAKPGRLAMSDGRQTAGIVRVPLSGSSITVSSAVSGSVWADVVGYSVPTGSSGAGTFVQATEPSSMQKVSTGANSFSTVSLSKAPKGVVGVVLAVKVESPSGSGSVSICPLTQTDSSCRKTSLLNVAAGESRIATSISQIPPSGKIKLYSAGVATTGSVSVLGWFVEGTSGTELVDVSATANTTVIVGTTEYLTPSLPKGAVAVIADVTMAGAWREAVVTSCARPGSTGCAKQPIAGTFASVGKGRTSHVILPVDSKGRVVLSGEGASVRVSLVVRGAFVPVTSSSTTSTPASNPPAASVPETPSLTGSTSVGVPAGVTLKKVSGNMFITKAGTVVDGIDLNGRIAVQAPNVVIKNSIIRGDGTQLMNPVIMSLSTNLLIQDSEIAAKTPSPNVLGVIGSNFTLVRVNIHDVIDAVHIYGAGSVTVKDSWLHDNLHYESLPELNGGPSHDDSIQIISGSNIVITGNTMEDAYGAAIQFTQDKGSVSNVRVENNTIGGGGCSLNFAEKGRGPFKSIAVKNNVFKRDQRIKGCAVVRPITSDVSLVGNTWTDGTVVKVSTGS